MSSLLPPHLSHLKDVHASLPDPNGDHTAPVPAVDARAQIRRGFSAEPLHGPEPASGVILDEPPEAQDLDQHRRHQHEEQREPEPQIVPFGVVVQGQPQVRADVPEEDEQREDDPEAVQPQALLRLVLMLRPPASSISSISFSSSSSSSSNNKSSSPVSQQRLQTRAPAAPVARRRVAAVADVYSRAVQRILVADRLVQIVQLGETGNEPHAIGFCCHLALWNASSPPPSALRDVTSAIPVLVCVCVGERR